MIHAVKTFLPIFPGFYNTVLEPNEELMIEDGKKYEDYTWYYDEYDEKCGKACTYKVEEMLKEIGILVKIKFEAVASPKYYNFSNDSVNVIMFISDNTLSHIKSLLHTHIEAFTEYIKDKYTSCSGFISHYSNNVEDWLIDDFVSDMHKLASVLEFLLCTVHDSTDLVMELAYACEDIYPDCELKEDTI